MGKAYYNRLGTVFLDAFLLCRINRLLSSLRNVVKDHAGVGSAIIGIKTENSENCKVNTAALKDDVVLDTVVTLDN